MLTYFSIIPNLAITFHLTLVHQMLIFDYTQRKIKPKPVSFNCIYIHMKIF